jgi:hypothetical protein
MGRNDSGSSNSQPAMGISLHLGYRPVHSGCAECVSKMPTAQLPVERRATINRTGYVSRNSGGLMDPISKDELDRLVAGGESKMVEFKESPSLQYVQTTKTRYIDWRFTEELTGTKTPNLGVASMHGIERGMA